MAEMDEKWLELRSGMAVEVLNMDNTLVFSGKVVHYNGEALSIRDARGRAVPVGVYGKTVKLRFERSESNLMVCGKLCRSSPELWEVDELEEQFTAPRRSFFRQRINVKAEVICVRRNPDIQGTRGADWSPCKIVDVSIGGVQLSSKWPFQVGDLLSVRGARLVAGGPELSFSCRVLRSLSGLNATQCGCRIEAISNREQKLLEEAIFTLQREEIQRRRLRDRE